MWLLLAMAYPRLRVTKERPRYDYIQDNSDELNTLETHIINQSANLSPKDPSSTTTTMSSASSLNSSNALVAPHIYLGPESTPNVLLEVKVTRIFGFYAGVHFVALLPDGTHGERKHLGNNEYDYLKDFQVLCTLLQETISKGDNVFFYVHEDDEETDNSRAYTLVEAWRIWNGEKWKKGDKIVKHHKEQLRVCAAMLADWSRRHVIYLAWKGDVAKGERWQGVGLPGPEKLVQQTRRRM